MNNKISFVIITLLFFGCKSNQIILKTGLTEQPVIINYNKEYNKVYGIKIPIQLNVINKSIFFKNFITIDYKYHPYEKGVGEEVYLKNDSIYKIKNNKKKTISSLDEDIYIIYARYRIDRFDTLNIYKNDFKRYTEKMLAQNKDTLHIGTVEAFKVKHKELFEKLTKNDSISIQFLDNGELGERLIVPVEW